MDYNGIDRIDDSIGYTIDNCVTCCRTCNWAKGNKDYSEFLFYIDRLIKNRKNIKLIK